MSSTQESSGAASTSLEAQGPLSDVESIGLCNQIVDSCKRGAQSKADSILLLRDVLQRSASIRMGKNLGEALTVYLDIIEEACRAKKRAFRQEASRGKEPESRTLSENDPSRESDRDEGEDVQQESEESDGSVERSAEEPERPVKRLKTKPDPKRFPWHQRRSTELATLSTDIRKTFEQLELFASDPKSVVENILSTPGCPPFPPSQWLHLVQWKYVDLAKVLEAAYH